jgi:hypothetical protein
MKKRIRISPRRLLKDYMVMGKMSGELRSFRKNVKKLEAKVAAVSRKSDIGEGTIDDLEDIFGHLTKAQRELDRARMKLERI